MSRSRDQINKALPKVIKIALVDDQALFRAGIISLLKGIDNLQVITEASNGKEFIDQLKRVTPHVVLLDIEMPEMNGIETLLYLRENHPAIKVIMLTLHSEEGFIFNLITKGAHGFLPKDKSVEEVIDAIYAVIESGRYYNKQTHEALLNGSKILANGPYTNSFSEKEVEVIRMICRQKTAKDIADEMGISSRTVEKYRAALLDKTGSKNTAGMIIYALKHKIISVSDML